jgi:hypothetical protein
VQAELLEDVLDVGADGVLADEQVPPDAGVVPAPAEQGQHLALTRRQARQRRVGGPVPGGHAPGQLQQHGPGDGPLALQHRPGDPQHRAGPVGLGDDPGGAGADRGQQQVGVVVVAEHDHPGLGAGLQDAGDQVGCALQAEAGVDQHQVGAEAGDMGEGVGGRGAAPDDLVGVAAGEQRLQGLVEQRLRIRKQHPCHRHPRRSSELSTSLRLPTVADPPKSALLQAP